MKFREWYLNYQSTIVSDFVTTYNGIAPTGYNDLSVDEGTKILTWIWVSIHKLHYLEILKEDGSKYNSFEEFQEDIQIQDELAYVFKHNIMAIVNNYKQLSTYCNLEDGKNIMETKFNPIDNTQDILKNSSNSGTVQTNKHDIAFKQNMYIKDAHELIVKIYREFKQYLEVYT